MTTGHLSLAFVAGILTTLSPCVLPVLPFVTASSVAKNKFGPIAMACGLLITFVLVTLAVSRTGEFLGVDPRSIRRISGAFLAMGGVLFLSARLSEGLASSLSQITGRAATLSQQKFGGPLVTEFIAGILLGIVWTPCSGPSLGVALGLATQAEGVRPATVILTFFGVGAVLPLILFAYGARKVLGKLRDHAGVIGSFKKLFGILMVLFGLLILLDWDRIAERLLTSSLPDFWVEFITKF